MILKLRNFVTSSVHKGQVIIKLWNFVTMV